jgi:hypothetical protein
MWLFIFLGSMWIIIFVFVHFICTNYLPLCVGYVTILINHHNLIDKKTIQNHFKIKNHIFSIQCRAHFHTLVSRLLFKHRHRPHIAYSWAFLQWVGSFTLTLIHCLMLHYFILWLFDSIIYLFISYLSV